MTMYETLMKAINSSHMPTEAQKEVITSDASSILVVAGAGSGKTRTMSNRIAYWVGTGEILPSEVLGLTFTRKAAGELEERVAASLSAIYKHVPSRDKVEDSEIATLERPTISTYNSFGSDIATSYSLLIGVDSGARLMGEAERYQCMDSIVEELDASLVQSFNSAKSSVVRYALNMAGSLRDNDVSIDEARSFFERSVSNLEAIIGKASELSGAEKKIWKDICVKSPASLHEKMLILDVVERYWQRKKDEGLLEFADQIALAVKILESHPDIGKEISARYRLVLLDEYQDTSVLQARMLGAALGYSGADIGDSSLWRSVAAVGDPNQAIYGWRGASANAFADFSAIFHALGDYKFFPLATTFRNDRKVLEAANTVARRIENGAIGVSELVARDGAGQGKLVEIRPLRRKDSYAAIALRIRDKIREVNACEAKKAKECDGYTPRLPEIAILCRNRSYGYDAAEELDKLGVPYEIMGGRSLLDCPEIVTVRAALNAATYPQRADALARLCAYLNIGVSDLRALHALSRRISKEKSQQNTEIDSSGTLSLIEVLDVLEEYEVENMSRQAYERLTWLAGVLRTLRSRNDVSLGDTVHNAANLLGITVSAFSRTKDTQRVITSLNAFAQLAYDYSSVRPHVTMQDFLSWLDVVDTEEHGGEGQSGGDDSVDVSSDDVEVHPGVVQIMTIHAAKGLEWKDLVVVPEMVDSGFSVVKTPTIWMTQNKGAIYPYPLRMDYEHMPKFSFASVSPDNDDASLMLARSFAEFKEDELDYKSQEERRLAYVAFTRVTDELLLAGYGVKNPENAIKETKKYGKQVKIEQRSDFLKDIELTPIVDVSYETWAAEYGEEYAQRLVYVCPEDMECEEYESLIGEDEKVKDVKDIPDFSSMDTYVCYPRDLVRTLGEAIRVDNDEAMAMLDVLEEEGELLIAERQEQEQKQSHYFARPYITATEMVSLSRNPDKFFAQQIRPVPYKPSRASRVGTEVHKRIAHSYLLAPIVDLDAETAPVVLNSEKIEQLFSAYERSRWARYAPLAIEAPVSIVLAGKVIRCTIDAVLDTSSADDLRAITIVDWKTGRMPNESELKHRQLQLAMYRLAYARLHDVPLEDISAVFVYLDASGEVSEVHASDVSEDAIIQLLRNYEDTVA